MGRNDKLANRKVELVIPREDSGKKLHRYLRQALPGMPLSGIYKMIRVGRVKVNGKKGKMDSPLNAGDQLLIFMSSDDYQDLKKEQPKYSGISTAIDIIFEDKSILVVNKPAGLLTHPDTKEQKDTLVNRVLAYLYHKGEISETRAFLPAPVNRLDRNTSGIVLFGKDQTALRSLTAAVRDRNVKKTYLGIVWGEWEGEGDIKLHLVKENKPSGTVHMKVNKADEGVSAHTRYQVLGSTPIYALVRLDLISGRTHQLRAHLESVGHPLVGDIKYGGKAGLGANYQLLHAYSLTLPSGEKWLAAPPQLFIQALKHANLMSYLPRD